MDKYLTFKNVEYDENGKKINILEYFDFSTMVDDYLVELEIRNYSQNTIKTYNSILNKYFRFLETEDDLYDERHFLRSFKRYIQCLKRKKQVTQNYIYLVTVVIKKFLEFNKIFFLEEVGTPKRTKSLPKSLNETEVKNLINAVKWDAEKDSKAKQLTKLRDKLILTLLYASGLRVSELINLITRDVDFEERTVVVRGKGEKDRVVLFDHTSKQLAEEYLEKRDIDSPYLITNKNGDQITPRYIQIMIKKYAKEAGIKKKVTPHILRHSYATHLLKKGVNIRVIQQLLGHASLSTTQIYTSVDMATIKTLYDEAKRDD